MEVEPVSEGSDSTPPLMALLFNAKVLVEYIANFVSDFDPVTVCFWGRKLFIAASGYMGSASSKTSCPCKLPM
jgi:hypothetical protein